MSERNLFRQFRNVFSVSPNEYLTHIRIQRSAELLRDTNKQIGTLHLNADFATATILLKYSIK